MYKIMPFKEGYKDDMILCYLFAKDALGSSLKIKDDLLDIQKNYFDKGDMFWLAFDANDRVIGMIGTDTVSAVDLWLKRLFIKPPFKRNGIASALLSVAEEYARAKGITVIHTRFSDNYLEAAGFYAQRALAKRKEATV